MEHFKNQHNKLIKKAKGNFKVWVWEVWADSASARIYAIFLLNNPQQRSRLVDEWKNWTKQEADTLIYRN